MRILILDPIEYYHRLERNLNFAVEIVAEVARPEQGNYSVYRPTRETLAWIKKQADFDLIILGNNEGAGLVKAQCMSEDQRAKTVVVWSGYTEQETVPYRNLGITHFADRFDVEPEILRMIGK